MKKFLLSFLSLFLIAGLAYADVEWQLVTDASTLTAGDQLIITNADGTVAMSTVSNTNNRKTVEVTSQNNILKPNDQTLIVELGGSEGAWTFKTLNYQGTAGYFACNTSSSNHLKIQSNAMTATITFTNNVPTIKFSQGTRNILRYNPNNGTPLFACYASGQKDIAIYRSVETSGLKNAGLSFEEPSVTVDFADGTYTQTVTNPNNLTVVYSSENEDVATVNATTGEVTFVKKGTAKITASSEETAEFAQGSASYTLNITGKAMNIAEVKALANNSIVEIGFPTTVGFVFGKNIFVTDGEDWIQIYNTNSYKANDVIPAGWSATYTLYNNVTPELTNASNLPAATETAQINFRELTSNTITLDNINEVLILKDVVFAEATPATKDNFEATLNGETISLRNNYTLPSFPAVKCDVKVVVMAFNNAVSLYVTEYIATTPAPAPVASVANNVITLTSEEGLDIYYAVTTTNVAPDESAYNPYENGIDIESFTGDVNYVWAITKGEGYIASEPVFVGIFNNEAKEGITYTLVESADQLAADYWCVVVAKAGDKYFAMGADMAAVEVTVDNNTISAFASTFNATEYQYSAEGTLTPKSAAKSRAAEGALSVVMNGSVATVSNGEGTIGFDGTNFVIGSGNQELMLFTTGSDKNTGVDNIEIDNEAAPAEYYNLQGVRVENPANGLYIKRQGSKVEKVIIR